MTYKSYNNKAAARGQEIKNINIAYFNALNAAIAFIPDKDKGTEKGYKEVEKWADKFYDRWRIFYMEEVMPRTLTTTEREEKAYADDVKNEQIARKLQEKRDEEDENITRMKHEDEAFLEGVELSPDGVVSDDDLTV